MYIKYIGILLLSVMYREAMMFVPENPYLPSSR